VLATLGSSRAAMSRSINGGSHDAEGLATLVQRRIDQTMNC